MLVLLAACCALAAAPGRRLIEYADLPTPLQEHLRQQGVAAEGLPALVRAIEDSTSRRLREGEHDHLIYYLLQSTRFTRRPRIEPALSAREFVEGVGEVPAAVRLRVQDFLRALKRPGADERLDWFWKLLPPTERTPERLGAEYARAMRSLYRKEFAGEQRGWYRERGHSSDTQPESSCAVRMALEVVKVLEPDARLERALVVGPGLDFAPRTALDDSHPPRSYQPLALARRARLRVHSVDINDRVIDYFARLRGQPALTAGKLNIITERYEPSPAYDLVVVTNVLVYFSDTELLLALANIAAMLREGGYLVHNELRLELEAFAGALDLAPVQARTLRLAEGAKRPLFDSFVIHRKEFR
ncbi:MAG: methyltransferase [Acidobacteriota bacterium]